MRAGVESRLGRETEVPAAAERSARSGTMLMMNVTLITITTSSSSVEWKNAPISHAMEP